MNPPAKRVGLLGALAFSASALAQQPALPDAPSAAPAAPVFRLSPPPFRPAPTAAPTGFSFAAPQEKPRTPMLQDLQNATRARIAGLLPDSLEPLSSRATIRLKGRSAGVRVRW
ncbi:MAG: hypothetical protein PW734_00055 [Verrucomicrobium sp.]|nr:hypothetical protein [Verrucomicrobium sp.]